MERLNVLWLTPQLPCLRSGGQVRQYHLIRWLATRHQVTLVSLVQETNHDAVDELRGWGVRVEEVPFRAEPPAGTWSNRLRAWRDVIFDPEPRFARIYPVDHLRSAARALGDQGFDVLQADGLIAAPLMDVTPARARVMTSQNVEAANAAREAALSAPTVRRAQARIEARKLVRWEEQWVRRSDCNIAVSELDAAALRQLAPNVPTVVVPNGVDAAAFAPPNSAPARRGLVFFGTLGYAANTDAVDYLIAEIMPRVRPRVNAELYVIGGGASPALMRRARGHARMTGFVSDVRPYLWQAAVCVVPLRSGGGTRLKILEALAAGCAVVSTTIGAEGLDLGVGEEVAIGDTPDEFAGAVVDLLTDGGARERIARRGRDAVLSRYDWCMIAPQMEEAYRLALAHAR